jgi:hypothetical protein
VKIKKSFNCEKQLNVGGNICDVSSVKVDTAEHCRIASAGNLQNKEGLLSLLYLYKTR